MHLTSRRKLNLLNLYYVTCSDRKLNLSYCKNLKELSINNANLLKLNLNKNSRMQYVEFVHCGLKKIDLSGCKKLKNIRLTDNPLQTLIVSKKSGSTIKKQSQQAVRENGGRLVYR